MSGDPARRNFTIKSVLLSILLAMLLAASNAYLALKIGTTIAASIPAAVLSIGFFRLFKHHTVFECNLVQTAASAGEGTASAIAYVLPALLIIHIWTHIDYWICTLIVCLGGLLGVFFSVPLRRILLDFPGLKYPEGTAIGNVLRVSTEKGKLLSHLLKGIFAGGVVNFLQQGTQVVASSWALWWKPRSILIGMTFGFNPAAFAAGFIIGPEVALSMLLGIIIGWVILIPVMGLWIGIPNADNTYDAVMMLWSHHLRFVGVGALFVSAIWTLVTLVKPMWTNMRLNFSSLGKGKEVSEQDRDIPLLGVGLGIAVFSVLIFGLIAFIAHNVGLDFNATELVKIGGITLLFFMIVGFLLATICGYLTGMVGSTNNPLSSMVIISLLLLSLIYLSLFSLQNATEMTQVIGLVLLMSAITGCIAVITNENMQDLKAGKMIGATPWKQQVMLSVGVISASFVIAPVLNLLYNAYGFAGALPRANMDPTQILGAPQANLMASVVQGVFTHELQWTPIFIGMAIAIVIIAIDGIFLRKSHTRLMVTAIGLAIYLPPDVVTALMFGGFARFFVRQVWTKRKAGADQVAKVMEASNIVACGIVAGASLMGVILAIPFVISGNANVLAPNFINNPQWVIPINILGVLSVAVLVKMLLLRKKDVV